MIVMESPRITIYGKVLDNKDQTMVRDYNDWRQNQIWHYGNVNGSRGGESSYIIEFDIWNNEPAFNTLSGKEAVLDAKNIQLSVWSDETKTSSVGLNHGGIGFVNARCVTKNNKTSFQPIFGVVAFDEIYGNVAKKKGTLSGQLGGDHTIIQTKIVIPDIVASVGSPLPNGNATFMYSLTYDYE